MTGTAGSGLEDIDRLMQHYLAEQRAPGASLAITDHGRLVYARGFGYADVGARQPVKPESLFRIASVSKPFTSVAIMQLVDAGKLDLDTPVYQILDGYEPYLRAGAKYDQRQDKITIRYLLQHRGGWDRDVSFDGMFQSIRFARSLGTKPPAGQTEIIRCMRGVPLDFDPGKRFAYSNFGYCLLGRVIEKLTGEKYVDYMKQHVLAPVGIHAMTIGSSHLEGRKPNEVRYYAPYRDRSVFADNLRQWVPGPYGTFYLESMDSHGAWIASPTDLVRFASAFDDPDNSPLLSAKSIHTMFERPPGLAGYDETWQTSLRVLRRRLADSAQPQGETVLEMHGGSLPGTNTFLVRRKDGRDFAILFNSRETAVTDKIVMEARDQLNRAIDKITAWPDVDYFERPQAAVQAAGSQ